MSFLELREKNRDIEKSIECFVTFRAILGLLVKLFLEKKYTSQS